MVAVRNLGFLKLKFLTAMHFRDMFCIIVPLCNGKGGKGNVKKERKGKETVSMFNLQVQ